MNYDEDLKSIILQKSIYPFVLVSNFNPDVTKKNRKNGKKSRYLQEIILEYGFIYKPFVIPMPHGESKKEFLVFDNKAYENQKHSQEFEAFIKECKSIFNTFTILDDFDLKDYLKDKTFYHPIIKEEKKEYLKNNEIILENLFEPPSFSGKFSILKAKSETSFLYEKGPLLCSVKQEEDGRWIRVYGTIRPVGAVLKKEYFNTREEALKNL